MEAVFLRVVGPLLQYGTLGIAAIAMALVIAMLYRDNKQLQKDAVERERQGTEREKEHAAKMEELLMDRINALETAAKISAEASRLTLDARDLLRPKEKY